MKPRLILILMILLTACRSVNTKKIRSIERCIVKIEFNSCRCHTYNFETGERISESRDYDLEKCDKYIAVSVKDYGELSKVMESIRLLNNK